MSEIDTPSRVPGDQSPRTRYGRRLLGLGAILLLFGGLALGFWRHYTLHLEVTAAAEQHRDFVPSVRVAVVQASDATMNVTLPATTNAFQAANIYARASGYITERNVDIGSRVKTGDLLAAITAPELDHQIAQAAASLAQAKASRRQTKANRELARVTWGRDSVLVRQGWATQQQGDTDRLGYAAQQQATTVTSSGQPIHQNEIDYEVLPELADADQPDPGRMVTLATAPVTERSATTSSASGPKHPFDRANLRL